MIYYVEVKPNPAQQPNQFQTVCTDKGPVEYTTEKRAQEAADLMRESGAKIMGYRVRVVPAK